MTQKWNLQDIRPAEPRKRKVPPPTKRKQTSEHLASPAEVADRSYTAPATMSETGRGKKSNKLLVIVIFAVVVGGALVFSALTGKTELIISPEHREPTINAEYTAYPDKREKALSYEIMTLEADDESQVKATGQVMVQELAKGTVKITKTTPGAERLRKNTRFRTSEGLVFRIQESVVVPGAVENEPGTITAEVFADDVGESYNIGAGKTFDVPGFEEAGLTALYDAITAESVTDFAGGFDGPQFQIEEQELLNAREALQKQLRAALFARVQEERPADFVAFVPASVSVTYTQLPAVEYGDGLVTIREKATLQVPLFKADEFAQFLAREAVATYDGGAVRIVDPAALTFSYVSATTTASNLAVAPSLTFTLNGKPQLVWGYDIDKLTTDLAGLPKTALNNAVKAYPGIEEARARITPFWKQTFPKDSEDMVIIEELKDNE